ncbi:TPA: DUF551 domain-containing protein [Enterobacter asburiae]|nr:DUF551 domain-containing protein [Enterobacter asburiae]
MEAIRDDIPFGLGEDGTNTLAALRIALASLEAEAVCVIDQSNLDYLKSGSDADVWPASRAEMGDVLLYRAASPAAVSVPDGVLKSLLPDAEKPEFWFEHNGKIFFEGVKFNNAVFEACRAATLQRAEPVQGWIPCSDRMPTKNHRVLIFINFNSDTVPPSIHDAQFTGSTFRRGNATVNVFPLEDGYGVTHWMPLPAAPQQEA